MPRVYNGYMNRKELENLIKSFRPEFGNTNHTRALDLIQKIRNRDRIKQKLKVTRSELEELEGEIAREVENLKFLINQKS